MMKIRLKQDCSSNKMVTPSYTVYKDLWVEVPDNSYLYGEIEVFGREPAKPVEIPVAVITPKLTVKPIEPIPVTVPKPAKVLKYSAISELTAISGIGNSTMQSLKRIAKSDRVEDLVELLKFQSDYVKSRVRDDVFEKLVKELL